MELNNTLRVKDKEELIAIIRDLEAEIEDTKSCENCKHLVSGKCGVIPYFVNITEDVVYVSKDFYCNNHEPK